MYLKCIKHRLNAHGRVTWFTRAFYLIHTGVLPDSHGRVTWFTRACYLIPYKQCVVITIHVWKCVESIDRNINVQLNASSKGLTIYHQIFTCFNNVRIRYLSVCLIGSLTILHTDLKRTVETATYKLTTIKVASKYCTLIYSNMTRSTNVKWVSSSYHWTILNTWL